ADGAEDELVVAAVEVVVGDDVGDAVEGIGRQHQAAEHGLLGLDRLRRQAELLDAAFVVSLELGAEPLACAHQRCNSPGRTVAAILLLLCADRHRSRACPTVVADNSVANLWITPTRCTG